MTHGDKQLFRCRKRGTLYFIIFLIIFFQGCQFASPENDSEFTGQERGQQEQEKEAEENRSDPDVQDIEAVEQREAQETNGQNDIWAMEDDEEKFFPQQGGPVPDFKLESLSGETVKLDGLCGTAFVLLFWTDDCSVCLVAMELLDELYQSGQDIEVLGVSDLPEEKVRAYVEKTGVSFPMVLDPGKETFDSYLVEEIPTTIAVNAQGTLAMILRGALTPDRIEMMRRRMLHQWELDPTIK